MLSKALGAIAWSLLGLAAGCNIVGFAANAVSGPEEVKAAYTGLRGQRVGIMIWTDSGTLADFPTVQPDVAHGLEEKLKQAAPKADEVKEIDWVSADDILRFQQAHPELDTEPIDQIAPRLGVTRLIYVEISNISLRPNDDIELSRGSITVDLKVLEVAQGRATVGFKEDDVNAVYPSGSSAEGVPAIEDDLVYQKSVDALTTELARRFITYETKK